MGNQSVKSQDLIGESKEEEGFIGEDTIQYGYILAKGRRPYMEDFIKCQINYPERLVPHLGFFAVFDGHGGSRVAEHLESHLLDIFMATKFMNDDEKYLTSENIEAALNESFLQADEEVKRLSPMLTTITRRSRVNPLKTVKTEMYRGVETMGSTTTVVILTPKLIVVAHAGDSRAILVRGGKVAYSTEDHHPTVPAERKRIEEGGGEVRDNRVNGILAVSRALGDGMFKEESHLPIEKQLVTPVPVIKAIERSDDDEYILIASDGLWAVMNNDVTVSFLSQSERMENLLAGRTSMVVSELLHECVVNRRSRDNVSMILVKLRK